MANRKKTQAKQLLDKFVGCEKCGDIVGYAKDGTRCECFLKYAYHVTCLYADLNESAIEAGESLALSITPIDLERMINQRLCVIFAGTQEQCHAFTCWHIKKYLREFTSFDTTNTPWRIRYAERGQKLSYYDVLCTTLVGTKSFDTVDFYSTISGSCRALILFLPVKQPSDLLDPEEKQGNWFWNDDAQRFSKLTQRTKTLLARQQITKPAKLIDISHTVQVPDPWGNV